MKWKFEFVGKRFATTSIRRMSRIFASAIVTIILVVFAQQNFVLWKARADATIFWDGGGDAVSWADPLNWNTDVVPDALDDVLIDMSTTVDINEPITVNSLVLGRANGGTSPVLNFDYDAIASGPLTLSNGNLTVYPSAVITHTAGTGSISGKVNIDVQSGDATIIGEINVLGKGYQAGEGAYPGAISTSGAGGGSHGGFGGDGQNAVGGSGTNGSATAPTTLGSGGGIGDSTLSVHGGGVVKLFAGGVLTINGSINANGDYGVFSGNRDKGAYGGGAGGSVWISAGTVTGTGSVTADGGGASNGWGNRGGGGGGGGRIAIYYSSDSSNFERITASGGVPESDVITLSVMKGGAGTVYIKDNSAVYGDLVIDNYDTDWLDALERVAKTPIPAGLVLNDLTIKRYSNIDNSTGIESMGRVLVDSLSFFTIRSNLVTDVLEVRDGAWLYNEGSANISYNSFSWSNANLVDNGGTLALLSGGGALTIPSGSELHANYPRSYTDVIVNGKLTHTKNDSTEQYRIDYTAGSMTIGSSGSVDIEGKGYSGGSGPGAGVATTQGAGGGAHGGVGGDGAGASGGSSSYGEIFSPVTLGSGGGVAATTDGLLVHGGGAVKLVVTGTLTVNGSIKANGSYGYSPGQHNQGSHGGGAGGSVWIDTGELAGTGEILANGGDSASGSGSRNGGGGGGGRIAIFYSTNSSSLAKLEASGGLPVSAGSNMKGGSGTVYIKDKGAPLGELIIDGVDQEWLDSRVRVAKTPLPANLELSKISVKNYSDVAYYSSMSAQEVYVGRYSHLGIGSSLTADSILLEDSGWLYVESTANIVYSTLSWGGGRITDNGGTLALLSSGGALTIPVSSQLYANVPRTYSEVTVDGLLTHTEHNDQELYRINYTVGGNMVVSSTGSVNVSSKGYFTAQGLGPGNSSSSGGGGGAHAGLGGNGYGATGSVNAYGDPFGPITLGSGGGEGVGSYVSYGGGAVKLLVGGTLTINGDILADGDYGNSTGYVSQGAFGGGAGGSIWLDASTIEGNARISASGGGASYAYGGRSGGGGGGGRIAIYYDNDNTTLSEVIARGGKPANSSVSIQSGGAGTIYKKDKSLAYGDLRIDNYSADWTGVREKIALTPLPNNLAVANLVLENHSNVQYSSSMTVNNTLSIEDKSHFRVMGSVTSDLLEVLGESWLYNESGASIGYNSISWTGGKIIDNGGSMALLSGGGSLTIPSGSELYANVGRNYSDVLVNGVLTHTSHDDTALYRIDYNVAGNMTVSGSGQVNVSEKGFAMTKGDSPGVSGDGPGGGAHGGVGGAGAQRAGGSPAYGVPNTPTTLGSGGGDYAGAAGAGGGAVKLDVGGTLTVNGSVNADGGYGGSASSRGHGGGAGGSVWLIANNIAGTGSVTAKGGGSASGSSTSRHGGGGGGGRVAIYYHDDNMNFSALSVDGGIASGSTAEDGSEGSLLLAGYPYNPTNLRQFKTDGITAIAGGGSTDEPEILSKITMLDANDTDTLIPEVEIIPLGGSFSNIATHTGEAVAYTGSPVTGTVSVDGLADGESYRWQARVCDATSLCSEWVKFGSDPLVADVRIVTNANPNSPVIPESTYYINGQLTNNVQPAIGFVLSDPDSLDSVGYRFQMALDSTFNTPIIDYESTMQAQGTAWFTVGQGAGDGIYNVGAEGQELTTEGYYWRVMAIDDKGGESGWTVAPGTPAFRIDLTRPTNASNTVMKAHADAVHSYSELDDDYWFNRPDLYFSWEAGTDDEGIKGYCVYLGLDPAGDPAAQKGLLGPSPVSTTGSSCEFIIDALEIDFADLALRGQQWLTSSNDKYYLKLKAIDVANNVYVGPDESNFISFYFDSTPPDNVTSISAASGTFSSTEDMYFNWTTGEEHGGSDTHSGVLGFHYGINSRDNWFGEYIDDFTGISYLPMSTNQPFYLPEAARANIQLGSNTIYFRVIDVAGNKSELRTAVINYGGEAPKFSQGDEITVTPESSDINEYYFYWPDAQISDGNELFTYYYMINTPPPASYATILSNSATYIPLDDTFLGPDSFPGLRKGSNVIYVVAVDTAGNYSPSNYISTTFYLETDLPDPPLNTIVSDSSIKDASIWRVALVWDPPQYKGTGSLSYVIERSVDGEIWDSVATTSSTAYVDTVPESERYFWRIGSIDNSDESINNPSYTNAVSMIPRGKYTVPATLTSGPAVSSITTTKATVSWTTNRTADSKIAFGLASGNYFEWEPSMSVHVTDHRIGLTNLEPGQTYYYQAKWTDEDGNTGISDEYTFTTEPPPEVKDVRVSNVGISGSTINFTTINATKARVYYGPTTDFGGVREIGTSKIETSYSIALDNLTDGTKYYFRINTFDEEGQEYQGTILDFETLPRPRVFDVRVQQVSKTAEATLLVTWSSNTAVSSIVTFYPENRPELMQDAIDLDLVKGDHKMVLRGLFPDTAYLLTVRGRDIIGNEAVSSTIRVITSEDTRPPLIAGLNVEGSNVTLNDGGGQSTTSQLIITWQTDEPATSQVEYGEGSGSSYAQLTQEDTNLSQNHVVIISGLTPSKVYHFRAISKDAAGNESRSVDTVTITPKATNNAFYLVVTTLREVFGFLGEL